MVFIPIDKILARFSKLKRPDEGVRIEVQNYLNDKGLNIKLDQIKVKSNVVIVDVSGIQKTFIFTIRGEILNKLRESGYKNILDIR